MSDNSNLDENGNPISQEGDELTKERYKQIVAGKDALAEKQRNVIVTAFKEKDLGKAMRALAEVEPKVLASVLKETGFDSIEAYEASLKANQAPDEEQLKKAFEKFDTEKQALSAKEKVESQFNSLPEDIKETSKKEFQLLTEGRNLTAEQTEQMAQKAITLAQATHGTKHQIDYAKMAFASSSMSSTPVTEKKTDEVDTFIQTIASQNSNSFWKQTLPPNQ